MTTAEQIRNLEIRLQMAIEHVHQAERDLNLIRQKVGLPPVAPTFPPPVETSDFGSNGLVERDARRAAKAASLVAPPAAAPYGIPCFIKALHAQKAAEAAMAAEPAVDAKATADAIVRAAAIARGEIVELPPTGSEARAVLEAGAKRRSTDLEGKRL